MDLGMPVRIYFFCRPDQGAYQNELVVLAEGLRALGVTLHSNCNYWRSSLESDDWLLRHDPAVSPEDCDIVVISSIYPRWIDSRFKVHESPLPACLLLPADRRRYRTIFLDMEDGYETISHRPEYRNFDLVLRAQYNNRCYHPANHRPWVLGFSNRVATAVANARPWEERRPDLLINFNASHPYLHPARQLMEKRFVPSASRHFPINRDRDDLSREPADACEALMWKQTQQRHSQSYYNRLGSSQNVAAFCGEMIPAAPHRPPYLVGGGRAHLSRRIYECLDRMDPRPPRLIQWDSWRFWEALAAGCLVFNFDLPHYGVELPVMPENFVHYIGVRPDTVDNMLERLRADPETGRRIATSGREWALAHYSPDALARRFLNLAS